MKRAAAIAGAVVALSPAVTHADDARRPIAVDVDAGVPKLDRGGVHVVGGGTLGYAAPRWLAVARGRFAAYDFQGKAGIQQGERADGGVELGFTPALGERWSLDLRGSLGAATVDTTSISAVTPLHSEGSTLLRAGALVGPRWASSGAHAWLLLGGGAQREDHGQTVVAKAGEKVSLDDQTKTTFRGVARLGGRVPLWAERASLRARVETSVSSLRRNSRTLEVTTRGTPTVSDASATEATSQLELEARAFVDLDVLAIAGFVPAVFVGVDVVRVSGDQGTATATVPVLGLGLFAP